MTTATQVSQAGVPFPMIRAIRESKNCAVGVVPEWTAVNEQQVAFLDNHFNPTKDEADTIEEIEATASDDADVINSFLRERGFSIALEPLAADEYGMAAVLDYPWKWQHEGEEEALHIEQEDGSTKHYPSIVLDDGIQFFQTDTGQVVVRIETKTDDIIWMSMEENPATDYDLVIQAQKLQQAAQLGSQDVCITVKDFRGGEVPAGAVQFPCVDLDLETQVDFLINMYGFNERGQKATITQALQQTKLRMNNIGGRCQSAAAVGMSLECFIEPTASYDINKPFLLWLERPTLSQPLFALHLCPEVWSKPKDLD